MKNKKFDKAVWEIRKKYKRGHLTKKMLQEAHDLYSQAEGNLERFKELLKGI